MVTAFHLSAAKLPSCQEPAGRWRWADVGDGDDDGDGW